MAAFASSLPVSASSAPLSLRIEFAGGAAVLYHPEVPSIGCSTVSSTGCAALCVVAAAAAAMRRRRAARSAPPRRPGARQVVAKAADDDDGAKGAASVSVSDEAAAKRRVDGAFAGIALPSFAQLCTDPLAGLVDTANIGHLSRAALGGMGVAVAAQYSLTKLFNDPLLRVTTSLVASAPKDEKGESAIAVMILALILGVAQMVLFGPGAGTAIQGLGISTDAEMYVPAVAYLRVRAFGAPCGSALLALTGVCRGLGDAKSPFYASVLATIVNIVLDPLLIFNLGWGCGGAAAATVIAQACGAILLVFRLSGARGRGELGTSSGGFRWQVLVRVLRNFMVTAGVMIARNWGKVFCFTFMARQAALQGPVVAAAHGLVFQLGFATSQVAESLATSTQVLIAQALRAIKDTSAVYQFAPLPPRTAARWIVRRGLQLGLVMSLALSGLTYLGQGRILGALTSDAAVQAACTAVMPVVLLCQIFKALAYPMNGSLMGALDWSFSAVVLWTAGAAGVGLFSFLASFGVVDLRTVWFGLTTFFATQVVLGLGRIFSGTGPWRALREAA